AISGANGQSYTGRRGISRSERGGLAVAGAEGHATGIYLVVGERGEAEVLDGPRGPGSPPPSVAGSTRAESPSTLVRTTSPGSPYRVRFDDGARPFAACALLNPSCSWSATMIATHGPRPDDQPRQLSPASRIHVTLLSRW